MMSFRNTVRVSKLQTKNKMVGKSFSTLNDDERREIPWLGKAFFIFPEDRVEFESDEEFEKEKELTDNQRTEFIKNYREETARMLKENPNLKIR